MTTIPLQRRSLAAESIRPADAPEFITWGALLKTVAHHRTVTLHSLVLGIVAAASAVAVLS